MFITKKKRTAIVDDYIETIVHLTDALSVAGIVLG